MRYLTLVRTGLLSLLLLGAVASVTRADFQFFTGNPSGFQSTLNSLGMTDSNVLFNHDGLNLAGFTVDGYVNRTDFQRVNVSSSEMLRLSGGQAQSVWAEDGGLNNAGISPHPDNESANQSFSSLAFNIVNRGPDGSVTVNILDGDGNVVDSITFDLGPGNDFFGVIGLDDTTFASAEITSTDDIDRIRQIRVGFGGGGGGPSGDDDDDDDDDGGGGEEVVPEPSSVFGWLVVSAIMGLVVCRNRRTRRTRR